MKYKILHTEWSDGMGGQEMRILLDLKVMSELGHEAVLMAVPGSRIGPKAEADGIRVIYQPMKGSFDPRSFYRMVKTLNRERFDVVNTHSSVDSWLASAASKLVKTPVLIRTRHLSAPVKNHAFNVVYDWPDGIVTTAEMIRRRLIDVNGMEEGRVISIPTGVDIDRFHPGLDPGPIREELGIGPEEKVMTMVAVLRSWKRHETFLQTGAILAKTRPDLRILVVGEGPYRETVERHVAELALQDRVVMTGHRNDVPRILAISDVCCLTSDKNEGVPQSVLQYQAMARPVVGTDAGGIPEVALHEKTGLICPPNDPEALAAAVGRLLDDREYAAWLGRNARAMVEEKHSVQAMAGATLDFYDKFYMAKRT